MIYKLSLAFFLTTASLLAMEAPIDLDQVDIEQMVLIIPDSQIRKSSDDAKTILLCDKNGFFVKKGEVYQRISLFNTDPVFRKMSLKQIAQYACMNTFILKECVEGEYEVRVHGGLKGGGVGGVTVGALFGKFIVHFVGHGAIQIAATCTGPAYPTTVFALEAAFLPFIESTSTAAAVAGGILVGSMTGPV